MNEPSNRSHFTPDGWRTVTPRLVTREPQQLVEFIKQVFEATGEYRTDRPTVLKIGDSLIMISDADLRDPAPGFLYVYVSDTDGTYKRALDGGASSLEKPSNLPYGDRRGMVKDKWGNIWQIACYQGKAD
jgi:PhnB protein